MDDMGWPYLAIAFVGIVVIVSLLLVLTKQRPRGAALIFALALLYVPKFVIPENDNRELQLLDGTLRLSGFIGLFVGIYGLIRKLPNEVPRHPAVQTDSETVEQ